MANAAMTGPEVRAWLSARGITTAQFAREADLYLPVAYAILNGSEKVGPTRKARIAAALEKLECECGARQSS